MRARSVHAAQPSAPRARGFTLVELMVALSGGLFLSVVVFALARDASRFYQREARLATATLGGITGFERLKSDIMRASYLSTPNFDADSQVRPSGNAAISSLVGINITRDTSLQALPPYQQNASAGQVLNPDRIQISGSFAATDEFPGSVDVSRTVVSLNANSPALARTGFIQADDATKARLVEEFFRPGKILRFVEIGSRVQSYGIIASTTVTTGTPQITLQAALDGIDGFAAGSSVSVVDRVGYAIRKLRGSGDDGPWKPLYDASGDVAGEEDRTELVREELDAAGLVISREIAAEYAVDLKFGVTGQVNPGDPLVYASSWDASDTANFDALIARPQGIRSVRVRLSVRSREADRDANITSPPGGPIYRFKLGTNLGWARVRTFQADVALPNQAAVQW
ncbi:MAG TPA: prepilin-type N-terminal cleavage/methylation domain-containing protein [Polyangiaceae bacterium]